MQKADSPHPSDAESDVWLDDSDDIGETLDDTPIKDPEASPETAPKTASQSSSDTSPRSGPTQMSIEQWLESLRRSDRAFYNMMAMEVWSIAKSMDTLIPGFWSRFMENRQLAVKNFVHDRRNPQAGLRLEDLGTPEERKGDPSQN